MVFLPNKKTLVSVCPNCFSNQPSQDCVSPSCRSFSLQLKKDHRASFPSYNKATAAAQQYLAKSKVLGWQYLSSQDRLCPASEETSGQTEVWSAPKEQQVEIKGPDTADTIEGYYRHTLYNSAPALQKGW